MKNKPERISCILSILANRVGESISALASEIGVSDMTIRRDLHELSAQGYTTVINGVAILNDNQDGSKIKKDYFIHDERQSMSGSKEAIGLEACKLIEPNDIINPSGSAPRSVSANISSVLAKPENSVVNTV